MGLIRIVIILALIAGAIYYFSSPEQRANYLSNIKSTTSPSPKLVQQTLAGQEVVWYGKPVKEFNCAIDTDCKPYLCDEASGKCYAMA